MTRVSDEMNEAEPGSPYELKVDLNVLDHLADGLYSNVAAVVTEMVANAWDAEATEIRIDMNVKEDSITISDNGHGMDLTEANQRFLTVGYRRRDDSGDVTETMKRPVMGRKGIGKLSAFSIADDIKVFSKRIGMDKPIGFHIEVPVLKEKMKESSPAYYPEPIEAPIGFPEQGTLIKLSRLKRKRLKETSSDSLRRRLARRFSVVGSSNFRVILNNIEVTLSDRDDVKFVEYLWTFGNELPEYVERSIEARDNLKGRFRLNGSGAPLREGRHIHGWIGTVDKPKSLKTNEGNLNSVVVFSRGRLVMEDVLPAIAGAEMYTKYVTGQVEADFLDDSSLEDIVTSNRQSLIEDDERFVELIGFLKKRIREIADKWSNLRTLDKTDELRNNYPKVGVWLDSLEPGWKKKAEKLLGRIATMEFSNEVEDEVESRKTLLRHAIFGFERLMIRGDAEELEAALGKGVDSVLKLLADRDSLEASMYADIVKNRLEVIEELISKVDANARERILQEYLFDHLWLLDPSWERASGSEAMETRLRMSEVFKDDDEIKEKYGRTDISFRTVAGKHLIIELKRSSVKTNIHVLAEQGSKYVDAYKELFPPEDRDRINIEVIFVVGNAPKDPPCRVKYMLDGVSPGSSIVTYEQLIIGAREAYGEYLKRVREVDRLERILST